MFKNLIQEFNSITLEKCFEIEVVHKKNMEVDHIIFDIEINDKKLYASHQSLTYLQEQSDKVAYVSIDLDEDYDLNEHLQHLYERCINAILESDFYNLSM